MGRGIDEVILWSSALVALGAIAGHTYEATGTRTHVLLLCDSPIDAHGATAVRSTPQSSADVARIKFSLSIYIFSYRPPHSNGFFEHDHGVEQVFVIAAVGWHTRARESLYCLQELCRSLCAAAARHLRIGSSARRESLTLYHDHLHLKYLPASVDFPSLSGQSSLVYRQTQMSIPEINLNEMRYVFRSSTSPFALHIAVSIHEVDIVFRQ